MDQTVAPNSPGFLFGAERLGLSVNKARSLGPAVCVGGNALAQVWLFLIAPVIGGALAGVVDKMTEAAYARRTPPAVPV